MCPCSFGLAAPDARGSSHPFVVSGSTLHSSSMVHKTDFSVCLVTVTMLQEVTFVQVPVLDVRTRVSTVPSARRLRRTLCFPLPLQRLLLLFVSLPFRIVGVPAHLVCRSQMVGMVSRSLRWLWVTLTHPIIGLHSAYALSVREPSTVYVACRCISDMPMLKCTTRKLTWKELSQGGTTRKLTSSRVEKLRSEQRFTTSTKFSAPSFPHALSNPSSPIGSNRLTETSWPR